MWSLNSPMNLTPPNMEGQTATMLCDAARSTRVAPKEKRLERFADMCRLVIDKLYIHIYIYRVTISISLFLSLSLSIYIYIYCHIPYVYNYIYLYT